jgi:hypothetical protein
VSKKGRLKRVFTLDLKKELREHAVNLQIIMYGMCGVEVRKLAYEYVEADHLQRHFNKDEENV